MGLVREERMRHREMITTLNNTTFAMDRRLVVDRVERRSNRRRRQLPPRQRDEENQIQQESRQWHCTQNQLKKECPEKGYVNKDESGGMKSVHFGSMVTFDDSSTPVPIRPNRKKQPKSISYCLQTRRETDSTQYSRIIVQEKREEFIPNPPPRPDRSYKGREMTPLTLALLPLNYQQMDKIPGTIS